MYDIRIIGSVRTSRESKKRKSNVVGSSSKMSHDHPALSDPPLPPSPPPSPLPAFSAHQDEFRRELDGADFQKMKTLRVQVC